MVGYVKPGEKFGATIERVGLTGIRWVFPVPPQFIGEKDCILVAEHPDCTIEADGNNRIVHARNVDLVRDFPSENGLYIGDPKYDIPQGRQLEHGRNISPLDGARTLKRTSENVAPIGRGYIHCFIPLDWWVIYLNDCPSSNPNFKVAAEAPEELKQSIADYRGEDENSGDDDIAFVRDIFNSIKRIARHLPKGV